MADLNYCIQFDVIAYSPTGDMIPVCFHGPTRQGFHSVEMAKKVIEALEKADAEANNTRMYGIMPVMVDSEYGKAGEVTFDLGEDADEIDEMIEAAEREEAKEKNEPPKSN